MCVLSCFSHVQLYVAPRTAVHQAPLSMEFSRQESWSGLPCAPPGDLPDPGTKPESPISPALAGRFFTMSVTGEAQYTYTHIHIHVVAQSLSHVRPFATPRTAACQSSLSFTISQSLLKLISIESVMPSNHLFLCYPLLLLPSTFLSIRDFFNESALCIKRPKYWSFEYYESMNIYIYVHRRICFPTVEAFAGDIIQDRVRIYADLVSWVKSLGTSKRAIHSIASITRVASWEIKTGTMEWRRLSRLNSQHPGILPAEHGPASSSHVCGCYLS